MNSKQILNPKAIGIAAAVITFILSILCLVIVLVFKDSSTFFNLFFHGIDLSQIKTVPDIARGILGSVILTIIAFVIGWFFAIIYNKFIKFFE